MKQKSQKFLEEIVKNLLKSNHRTDCVLGKNSQLSFGKQHLYFLLDLANLTNFQHTLFGMTKPIAPIAVEILFLFFGKKRKRLQRKAGLSS
ncbi:hypothetical protein DTW91_10825 [Chryseobacterium sp. SC28]|nr:hypothetical protein DTW91_10825 [Chryseobacterium sp. SC28]